MPALRQAGGPGGRGDFRYTWRGAEVAQFLDDGVEQAMIQLRLEIEGSLRSELHKWPYHTEHQLSEQAFAEVSTRGGRRVLVAGSRAFFALYHELGTRYFTGHPQIREILDRYIRQIGPRIKSAVGN